MPSLFASGEFVLAYPTIYGIASNQRLSGFVHALSKHPDLDIECYDDVTMLACTYISSTFEGIGTVD